MLLDIRSVNRKVFLGFLLASGLVCMGYASTAAFDIEDGAHYMKPLDFAVSEDQVYILLQRLASDRSTAGLLEGATELILEGRSLSSGEKLWTAELKPKLFGSYDSFGSIRRDKVAYHQGWLTILITNPEEGASFLLNVGADGRFGGQRTFKGEGTFGIGLHRRNDGIAVAFPQGVQWLNDELKTVAEWRTSNVLMAARGQGDVLWVAEGEPPLTGPLDYHAGLLRSLTFDGNVVEDKLASPLPRLAPLMPPSILTWPDEAVVLIPDVPQWWRCAFRAGMTEAACKGATWKYAPPGMPMSLHTVVSGAGTDGYLIAVSSFCDVLAVRYDRSHDVADDQAYFPGGHHVRVSDLIVKEDGGEVFALIAGERGAPGSGGHRTTFWPVRFDEATASPGDGRPAACPAWGNHDFFYQATAEDVAVCIEAGADPNAINRCDEYFGKPPLAFALLFSTPEVVSLLLQAGADADFRYGDGSNLLHKAYWPRHADVLAPLLRAMKDVNARDNSGMTALHRAARRLPPEVVDVLLDGGVDPTLRDHAGKLPWDYARENPELNGSKALNRLKPGGG